MAATVTLLRPYVASKTLRRMARERREAAMWALLEGKPRRRKRFLKQAEELEGEAQRAEQWETECELTRLAATRILEKALKAAQREGKGLEA